jgi:4-amino-4-deoxy-L-arabinose transferase-like glycosyltransferase
MRNFINKYTTAITATLFLVVAGSGVAMFFHLGKNVLSEMHEWLAVALVLAAGLHIYKNRAALKTYFRRRTIYAPLALALVAAAAFIVPASLSQRGDPVRTLMQAMQNAKLADVGTVLDVLPSELEAALKRQGFVIESSDARLSEIARASDKPARAVLMTVLDAAGE